MLSVSFSWTVPPPGILGSAERLDVRAVLQRELRDVADEILEDLVLGDEVGFRVDLDDGAALAFDDQRRRGPRTPYGQPSWRQPTDPWRAASRSRLPCRHWSRQAPSCSPSCRRSVRSRSSFTVAAVISAMFIFLLVPRRRPGSSPDLGIGTGPLPIAGVSQIRLPARPRPAARPSRRCPAPRAAALPVRPSPTACATASV